MLQKDKTRKLIDKMMAIRSRVVALEAGYDAVISELDPNYKDSARNLLRYLALRTFNLKKLQKELSSRGLSSIGYSERYTLANIDNILHLLHLLVGEQYYGNIISIEHKTTYKTSWKKLSRNRFELLGDISDDRPHIMVTIPSEAAEQYELIYQLIESGMNVARINCSHDDEAAWGAMISNIHRANVELQTSCRIYMDLAGPKLRTGEVAVKKNKKNKKKPVNYITLLKGDTLLLHKEPILGGDAVLDKLGNISKPAKISVTIPEIFEYIKAGESIWFDDGKIGALIETVDKGIARLAITHARPQGSKLRAEKGINLPETQLDLPSLTDEDLEILPFVAQHADIIGYSFVKKPEDITILQSHLARLKRQDVGLVLKIENRAAFENLPSLLLTAMKNPAVGVMIARGDLAVEIGWERISEVQEEILWICEAAHIPIIWATQVLENLAKGGLASRAEITDAAMGNRAECVMLNKGPFVVDAVHMLDGILRRMQGHQQKKKGILRALKLATHFFENDLITDKKKI